MIKNLIGEPLDVNRKILLKCAFSAREKVDKKTLKTLIFFSPLQSVCVSKKKMFVEIRPPNS